MQSGSPHPIARRSNSADIIGRLRTQFQSQPRSSVRQLLSSFTVAASLSVLLAPNAAAQTPAAAVTLTRLDCGTSATPTDVSARFSDTYAYNGLKVQLAISCYLIRHGDDYLVWDTGNPVGNTPTAPKTSLVDLLAQLKVTPDQVKFVGVSHYHGDHTGQVSSFPKATLFIGKGDWDILTDPKPAGTVNAAPFANWISGGGKVEPLSV